MKKLRKWWDRNKLNILTMFIGLPVAVAIVALFTQMFYFTFSGEWLIVGDRLAIGTIASTILTYGSYRLWVYFKILRDAG